MHHSLLLETLTGELEQQLVEAASCSSVICGRIQVRSSIYRWHWHGYYRFPHHWFKGQYQATSLNIRNANGKAPLKSMDLFYLLFCVWTLNYGNLNGIMKFQLSTHTVIGSDFLSESVVLMFSESVPRSNWLLSICRYFCVITDYNVRYFPRRRSVIHAYSSFQAHGSIRSIIYISKRRKT